MARRRIQAIAIATVCAIAAPIRAAQTSRFAGADPGAKQHEHHEGWKKASTFLSKKAHRLRSGLSRKAHRLRSGLKRKTLSLETIVAQVQKLPPSKVKELRKRTEKLLSHLPPSLVKARLRQAMRDPMLPMTLRGMAMRGGLIGLSFLVYAALGVADHAYAYHDLLGSGPVATPVNPFSILTNQTMANIVGHDFNVSGMESAHDHIRVIEREAYDVVDAIGLSQNDPRFREHVLGLTNETDLGVLDDPNHVVLVHASPADSAMQNAQRYYVPRSVLEGVITANADPGLQRFDYDPLIPKALAKDQGWLSIIGTATIPPTEVPKDADLPWIIVQVDPKDHEHVNLMLKVMHPDTYEPAKPMTIRDLSEQYEQSWQITKNTHVPGAVQRGMDTVHMLQSGAGLEKTVPLPGTSMISFRKPQ